VSLAVSPRRAALVIVDVQDRLAAVMPAREALERNVVVLCEAARRFGIPVVLSEQYPKGLGATTAAVAAAVEAVNGPDRGAHRLEKLEFSVCDAAGFGPLVAAGGPLAGRDQWIVAGMETHVCVWQTVRGLRGRGASVHVVADAVASRTDANKAIGLDLARAAGAVITSTETVVFDLLHRAGTDDFKALSLLIK
jgi:nicotinamidase-related amidase